MKESSTRLSHLRTWAVSRQADDWLAGVGLFIIVLILWLPFGLSIPLTYDQWVLLYVADHGVIIDPQAIRFLLYVPGAIGRVLSPNPFIGANVLLIGLTAGKAILVYLIFKRLLRSRAVAFAAASLVAVFPADTALFHAASNIHFAIFFYVLAVYLLLVYWEHPRWYLLLLMWFAEVVTTGTYEVVYPLLMLTPLLVVWLEGRITRRVITTAALWYAAPLVVLGRVALVVGQNQGAIAYQENLFATPTLPDLLTSLAHMYRVHFVDGWIRSGGTSYAAYGVIAALIGGGICWWLLREQPRVGLKTLLLLLIGGVAAIAVGNMAFWLTSLRDSSDRTYYYSALGAGLVLAVVFLGIAQMLKFTRLVFAVLTAGVVALGAVQVLNQHGVAVGGARAQEARLLAIITQAPAIQPGSLVLVIDETDGHSFASPFHSLQFYFEFALVDMYENYQLSAAVCYPNDQTPWGTFQETCHFEANQVVVASQNGTRQQSWPLNQVVAFRYHADGSLSLDENLAPYVTDAVGYDPKRLINFDAPLPPRVSILPAQNP